MLIRFVMTLILAMSLSCPAMANSGFGGVEAGGLQLEKTEDIAMISENLYISLNEIVIDYVFENKTDKDIEAKILFPIPEFAADHGSDQHIPYANVDERTGLQDNVLAFRVFSNDVEIFPSYEKRVKRSEDINQNGECDMGEGCTFISMTYFWQQTFTAGQKIHLKQRYVPAYSGEIGGSPVSLANAFRSDGHSDDDLYCTDKDFLDALVKRETQDGYQYASLAYLGYILTTAKSWAGGKIDHFRLVIDKGSPENLISFCGENVKKISPTQFEMVKKDYAPEKELNILYILQFSKMN